MFGDGRIELEQIRNWQKRDDEPSRTEYPHILADPFSNAAEDESGEEKQTQDRQILGRNRASPIGVASPAEGIHYRAFHVQVGGKNQEPRVVAQSPPH